MKLPPIEQLVPHEAPMRLIDEVTAFDADAATIESRTLPTDACLFVKDGKIPAVVSLEYMAQTVAAFVTCRRIVQAATAQFDANEALASEGTKPRPGVIIGIRKLELGVSHFELYHCLTTRAQLIYQDESSGSFECCVSQGDTVLASARLLVHEPSHVLAKL